MGRRVNSRVAGLPGVQQAVFTQAGAILQTAKTLAVGHGGLAGDISLERPNDYDVDVVLEHRNALSIEAGHFDAVFGSGWVEGLHILRDAARAHK